MTRNYLNILFWLLLLVPASVWSQQQTRLTVLYDAFGQNLSLKKDWGFSLLIEHAGKRVLFDTGNNAEIFAHNIATAGVDLTTLDFAVISHRHGDHMGGLSHLVKVAPELTLYAPQEGFGVFGATLPGDFYPANPDLPPHMRYFDGKPPPSLLFGTAWPNGHFEWVKTTTEISPGIHLIALIGEWGTDLALRELSLAIETEKGLVLIVGCSHPTIEKIVATAKQTLQKPVYLVIGGTHLLPASKPEINRIALNLHDNLNVDWIAPAHCTGEPAFEILNNIYNKHYVYAGLGSSIEIDSETGITSASPYAAARDDDLMLYRLLSQNDTMHNHNALSLNDH